MSQYMSHLNLCVCVCISAHHTNSSLYGISRRTQRQMGKGNQSNRCNGAQMIPTKTLSKPYWAPDLTWIPKGFAICLGDNADSSRSRAVPNMSRKSIIIFKGWFHSPTTCYNPAWYWNTRGNFYLSKGETHEFQPTGAKQNCFHQQRGI